MERANKTLTGNAKALRKNMTKEERHLWYDYLKAFPLMVHRQKVFGPYIVDFYIAAARTVVELDGSQHYEQTGQLADQKRDTYLRGLGLQILRYSNGDVNRHFEAVCQDIWNRVIGED